MLKTKVGTDPANIVKATNGHEAYISAQNEYFDLILMDLNMPVMNGYKAAHKIKEYFKESGIFVSDMNFNDSFSLKSSIKDHPEQDVPQNCPYIVALSGSDLDNATISKCKGAGFDDWFTTPISVDDLLSQVIDKIIVQKYIIIENESYYEKRVIKQKEVEPD